MIEMQCLVHSKYQRPLMGMPCIYAENAMEAQMVRGQSIELHDQLVKASTLILEETGVLLPMYHKALFSDSAYAAIMRASWDIAAMPHFLQIQHLEVWRCNFHFSGI